jgi:hypothetical protein
LKTSTKVNRVSQSGVELTRPVAGS